MELEPQAGSEPPARRPASSRDPKLAQALGRFDETRLRAAGLSDRDLEDLAARILRIDAEAQSELKEAQRRGEPLPGRVSDRIWSRLRADYGDEIFATLLFAANQVNRVDVEAVPPNSPGGAAGVLPGDVILYYDGQRIFTPQELRELTEGAGRAGQGGTRVLEVLREGRAFSLSVPPGALGVRVAGRSVKPEPR